MNYEIKSAQTASIREIYYDKNLNKIVYKNDLGIVSTLGSELEGPNYVCVLAQGTPTENAQEFIRAYAKAVAATKDEENRFTIVLAPGHYKLPETFKHTENYVNIVSLTGEQDLIFDLELKGEDPFVLSTPPPPVPFEYLKDLTIDIADGSEIYSDSLQNGQPNFLNITGQISPEIVFDPNGLGYRGNPFTTYPVYGGFSAGASDKVVASYKFTYEAYIGGNFKVNTISLYDNSLAILPDYHSNNVQQLYASIYNWGTLQISFSNFGGLSTNVSLTDGLDYILELVNDPANSIQEAFIKDSNGTVIESISLSYNQISASTYSVALGVDNQGPSYYPTLVDTSSVMDISADYSLISGIKTKEYFSRNYVLWTSEDDYTEDSYYPLPLNVIVDNYSNLEVKNCTAGPFSFGSNWGPDNFSDSNNLEAKFINCTALAYSFGYGAYRINSSSIFTNCNGGNYCFYIDDDLRGKYTNCTVGSRCFYSLNDDIEGTFINCKAVDYSFISSDDTLRATFIDCIGEISCFNGEFISNSSNFRNCIAQDSSFRARNDNNSGNYTNCTATVNSFYASSCNDATYISCRAEENSFYSSANCYGMQCYYSILTNGIFNGGSQYYCVDDNF